MRPIYAKALSNLGNRIFEIRHENCPNFLSEYHFHSECQLTYIIRSNGQRYIGDQLEDFESDELTFIGPGLPHVWHPEDTVPSEGHSAASITLIFDPEGLQSFCPLLFEISQLNDFLEKSRQGMLFYGETKNKLKKILQKMVSAPDIQKTVYLFKSLAILLHSEEYRILSDKLYIDGLPLKDGEIIFSIYNYVFENFNDEISLDEAAKLANLTKPSFCRFFKARTRKTFSKFVNEVRINEACRLLARDENPITHIAYACGFNSLPNFNKFFKAIKGITPSDYKNKLLSPKS
ncbi:AraC family transcriptional regulator [Sphingobacterium sp.]|uniref:helix-turn-helix domain-containing protein n=1 Tax=Sphingobacterium sp. TaxID=341027 RepID=UPI0028A82FD1|nr:AraC family transcriptional regulator [Sphingobacterium sp.]